MIITKLGHCCLVIETKRLRILTDPGEWSTNQNSVKNIDLILITHEHPDHFHLESLKQVLGNNPKAQIITNTAVGKLLAETKISFNEINHGENSSIQSVLIEGYGEKHAQVYPSITPVQNTGYFIDNTFFYPGDAFYNPKKQVEVLALPVSGPWMKLAEAIDYAKEMKPSHCFPVHDGMLKFLGSTHILPEKELNSVEIKFKVLAELEENEFLG